MVHGAQDYAIPQSHLTDMHTDVHVQQQEIEALQEARLKINKGRVSTST